MKLFKTLSLTGLLALCACSGTDVKDTLGLTRAAPDEFRVVSRPPLSVPPDFALRPPSTTDEGPNQQSASDQARSMVQGGAGTAVPTTSSGSAKSLLTGKQEQVPVSNVSESQFLKRAGADKADPSVREKLVEEKYAAEDKKENRSWWDIFSSDEPTEKEPIVNAKKESERIQKNEDEGKPVTEGKTPEVKGRDTGVLGEIFGY